MKIYYLLLCAFLLPNNLVFGQFQPLLHDSFPAIGTQKYVDLSTILYWGKEQTIKTAFQKGIKTDDAGLALQCIFPNDSALRYGSSFTDPTSLKTCTAIDYKLPVLNRENDSLLLEFDALWDSLIQTGEGGRLVVALLYDYPKQPISFGLMDSIQLKAPFGRPAYNIRILNRAGNSNPSGLTAPGYFFYGGGKDSLGEFEKTANYWLPGFIAQPGGFSPQTGPSYPLGPTTKVHVMMASQQFWMHFKMKFYPEMIELWIRPTAFSDTAYRLYTKISIPKTSPGLPYAINKLNQFYSSNINKLPLYYRWAPQFEALRFYFRSNSRSYLTNVKVQWSGTLAQENQKIEAKELTIYPNPNGTGIFQINRTDFDAFELYDLQGKKLGEGKIEFGKLSTRKPVPGQYMLILKQQKTGFTKRFSVIFE